jgi:hypothetical protein
LPGNLLHSAAIDIRGSGIGSVKPAAIADILDRLMNAAPSAGFRVATRVFPLSHIGEAWSIAAGTPRIVVTTNQ